MASTEPQLHRDLPVLEIESLDNPLQGAGIAHLEAILPEFLVQRRWFRAKSRQIQRVSVQDVILAGSADCYIVFTSVAYAAGEPDDYVLTLKFSGKTSESAVASYRAGDGTTGYVSDALFSADFRDSLLDLIRTQGTLKGNHGDLVASHTSALATTAKNKTRLDSFVSHAEQSNSSIIFGDQFILKIFRKVEQGINPDIEIGAFLTERAFRHTPAVLGTLEYRSNTQSESYAVAILQQFVPNQGDAWKYTLESLSGFFKRALALRDGPPRLPATHPLSLANEPVPQEQAELIGPYLESAALLGERTAEMHAALADPSAAGDFLPEEFSSEDAAHLRADLSKEIDSTFALLRHAPASEKSTRLLASEQKLRDRFSALTAQPIHAVRIRFHGDYHLGQVLYTGNDFMIIDFEGEPARPLSERRSKALAMRDVAGMIRSFQYAAYAALFGQVPGIQPDSANKDAIERWADFWASHASAALLNGYFRKAQDLPFLPASGEQRKLLLDAFLLHKALYEVAYEINNRPDWVDIPLRGILSLTN